MRLRSFVVFLLPLFFLHTSADARGRVIAGEFEHGEKYTAVYVAPEEAENARDDEDFDRYMFDKSWLQYDHELSKMLKVSLRGQRLDREYVSRPELDNATNQATLRLSVEPNEKWAFWPTVSIRERDYEVRPLDNRIWDAGITARYRWGVRDNIRFGASYSDAAYETESTRDRSNASAFATLEKPLAFLSGGTTIRIGARVEETRFAVQSASRENSTGASGSIGFRHEF